MTNSDNLALGVLELTLQLARSQRQLSACLSRETGGADLSFGQVVVLHTLMRSGAGSAGRVRQHELAKMLSTTKSNVVQLIDGLMAMNLIVREQDPSDRRANLIGLTEHGREVAEKMRPTTEKLSAKLRERVGEERLVEMMDWLREIDGLAAQPRGEGGERDAGKF